MPSKSSMFYEVPTGGFRWVTGRASGRDGRFLVRAQPNPQGPNWVGRRYRLDDFPALYRWFSDVEGDEQAIVEFANEYGALGAGVEPRIVVAEDDGGGVIPGEPIEQWTEAIKKMREAVQIWDAVQNGDVELLAQLASSLTHQPLMGAPAYEPPPGDPAWQWIRRMTPEERSTLEFLRPGDVVSPALYAVRDMVNSEIAFKAFPILAYNHQDARLAVEINPTHLLGALWLQFANAIEKQISNRRCQVCGKWFVVSSDQARKGRMYCSPACRTKAWRSRVAPPETD